jgi:tRNA nucleotidyltransferase (CCA-adding enzyme)
MAADLLAALRAAPGGGPLLDRLAGRADVWIVGGAVRDALLGREPRDFDLVVEGDAAALAGSLGTVREAHARFGTHEVDLGGVTVNVATARTERYPRPGALPEIVPASLDADLGRRDFTVNALAVGLDGELHALRHAADDLAAGVLRVLHENSFVDDPTRLWRLARYTARLGFAADERTAALAREAMTAGALETVAGARLGSELRLALDEPDPAAALAAAHGLGLLPRGTEDHPARVAGTLALLPGDGRRGLAALSAMAIGADPALLRRWLDALATPAADRDAVLAAAARAVDAATALGAAGSASEIAVAVRGLPVEAVAVAGALGPTEAAGRWLEELRHVRLEIDGDDLLAAGVPAGPDLGRRLDRALAARLDGKATGREQELAVALA